jgi:hypothetical protein
MDPNLEPQLGDTYEELEDDYYYLLDQLRKLNACVDCGWYGDDYMVTHAVWKLSGLPPDGGQLCLACLQRRLNRPLTIDDFPPCSPNRLAYAAAGKLNVVLEEEQRRLASKA